MLFELHVILWCFVDLKFDRRIQIIKALNIHYLYIVLSKICH